MSEKRELEFGAFAVALVFLLSAALLVPTAVGVKAEGNMPFFGTEYSLNWSGYAAATSETSPATSVTSVSASWVVPAVASPPKKGYSATWIGIGGFFLGDASLIQVGTAQFIERGVAYYFAWYELLPAYMTPIDTVSIEPGDAITASITWTAPNTWLITLDDSDTTGVDFTTTVTYVSSQRSAEWIEEAPSLGRKILPLANFGTVTFTGCQATIGGTTGPIDVFGYYEDIEMVVRYRGSYVTIATPSALFSDGTSFSISYG